MHRYWTVALTLGIALALSACGTSNSAGGNAGGADTAAAADTAKGSGDPTKNVAVVVTTSDSGQKANVEVDKAATKADAEAQTGKVGATNAGSQLVLWITSVGSDGSKMLEVHIDTAKYPLPAAGIPVSDVNGDAWVTYTLAGAAATGVYTSKGAGTIDIDSCPTKSGMAVTGKFANVQVEGDAVAMGAKSYTLNGLFNLVYFGTDATVQCKPAEQPKSDTSSGSVNVGSLKPPAGSSCDANPCDGGSNTTRNCCPYVPCIEPCFLNCTNSVSSCAQGCAADPMNMMACMTQCVKGVVVCENKCLPACNVSATCMTAAQAYFACEDQNGEACSQTQSSETCVMEKCCSELKAAF